jgi:CitMHS family citrate-Mg2+:H+ or citrate-Ca2+:H+ symporter
VSSDDPALRRPQLIIVNLILTIILLAVMILDIIPLGIAFMIAFCIASVINYPTERSAENYFQAHE